ncbi:MAG TPA: hypothetical protein VGC66_24450 [Pyrinomonadaceae bacterium]|jgi:hypothetical protein
MSKRIARQRKKGSTKPEKKSRRKLLILICVLISLALSISIIARWRALPGMLKPSMLTPPSSLSASNPSKEYIYAGNKLISTEEPTAVATPSATTTPTPPPSSSYSTENVVWTNAVGLSVNGNNLSKTAGWGWGNAGASSTKAIATGDGYVEFTVNDTHSSISLFGLSRGDADQDYIGIDFAMHPAGSGTLYIYEGGVGRGSVGPYAAGDKLRVAIEGGVVKYRRNGTLLYTSSVAPTYSLRADTAFYSPGATVSDVIISGQLQTVAGGNENVVWTNAVGLSVNGNNLSKTAGWGWGNAGASSTKAISSGDGYVEFTVTDNNFSISLFGLSHGDTNQDYTDVDFAMHPAGSGTLYIYEGGVGRGSVGPYAVGDKLRVSVEGGVVKYRRNGVLVYTSTVTPAYPLLVDTAFYSPGATVSDVVIYGQLQ